VGVPPVLGEGEVRYRVRFTLPHGSTGHWAREYATREEAQRAIDDRQKETGFAYVVEEVVATAAVPDASPEAATPEARIRELEAELAQLRDAYDAARQDLDVAKRNVARLEEALDASRQGPAKASGGAGGAAHTGPGHQSGAGQGVASRLIVDLGAIEREGPAKASEAPGETP